MHNSQSQVLSHLRLQGLLSGRLLGKGVTAGDNTEEFLPHSKSSATFLEIALALLLGHL